MLARGTIRAGSIIEATDFTGAQLNLDAGTGTEINIHGGVGSIIALDDDLSLQSTASGGNVSIFSASGQIRLNAPGAGAGDGILVGLNSSHKIGFYGANPITKPNVVGSRHTNPALANLLNVLEDLGILTDGTIA